MASATGSSAKPDGRIGFVASVSQDVIKRGKDDTQTNRQRYQCKGCRFH